MTKLAIMTIVAGEKYQEIWKRAEPFFNAYADKCGADLLVLKELPPLPSPHWAKFSIHELLKKQYDRIAFIDADIIIRPDTPSLFDLVPEDQFGIFNEGTYMPRAVCIREVMKVHDVKLPKWNGKDYYNTGVMVVSKQHRHIFTVSAAIKPLRNSFGEQTFLNLKIMNSDVKVFSLPYKFNRMSHLDRIIGVSRLDSYLVHYAGMDVMHGEGSTVKAMDKDIKRWEEDKPGYKYKQKIFIWALGGMGDCIAAEPTIRYMRETLYPDADIYLLTKKYFFFLYHHIKGITFLTEGEFVPEEIDAVCEFNTHPTIHDQNNEYATSFSSYCPHKMTNSIDWVSLVCINRQLNRKDKTIKLTYSDEDLEGVLKLCETPEDLILVHAGRGWETKTFPVSWWQEIINDLDDAGLKVGLIGKEVNDEHGYVPVVCPPHGVDFRDKTTLPEMVALIDQAPVLISNDSAPIFIAGAFENYLIVIPSCKEGDLIIPFRHCEQSYKVASLGKKTITDDEPLRITDLKGWQMAKLPVGHTIEEYIPDAGDVTKQAKTFFMQSKKLICMNKHKEAVNG
jgi:hypothetical protein